MKILLACQQSPHTYAIPAYGFWRTYFVEGLREAGHEIVEVPDVDWARGLLPLPPGEAESWRDEIWSRTLACARRTPGVNLFLGYLYPAQIEPSAVRTLHQMGVPTVNFFCDNLREYRRLPAAFAPFDLHWVPEISALTLYADRNWPACFAPMPCWVPPARRVVTVIEQPVVTFIGRRDPLRASLLATAARNGLPLAVQGGGWMGDETAPVRTPAPPTWRRRLADWKDYYQRQGLGPSWRRLTSRRRQSSPDESFDFSPWVHPSPAGEAYADHLARSAVTLGINRYPDPLADPANPPTYSRLRDIEAPMLGACYLTEWAPELAKMYTLETEIETYRNANELTAKAQALLADPARRRALRVAGQRRALSDHTLGCTVSRIASRLGLQIT